GCATLTYTTCAAPACRAAVTDARIEGRSTRRNSAAFDGDGCGVPTRCTSVSPGRSASWNDAASSALPTTASAPDGTRLDDSGRVNTRTSCPSSSRARTSRRPTYPVPPVMKTRAMTAAGSYGAGAHPDVRYLAA